jgi:hypothetical protein
MRPCAGLDQILRVLAEPTVETDLPGGCVRIAKGGVAGLGPSRREAAVDWWERFLEAVAEADPLADTDPHAPRLSPTEAAPPV